jgi:hypothetical protein
MAGPHAGAGAGLSMVWERSAIARPTPKCPPMPREANLASRWSAPDHREKIKDQARKTPKSRFPRRRLKPFPRTENHVEAWGSWHASRWSAPTRRGRPAEQTHLTNPKGRLHKTVDRASGCGSYMRFAKSRRQSQSADFQTRPRREDNGSDPPWHSTILARVACEGRFGASSAPASRWVPWTSFLPAQFSGRRVLCLPPRRAGWSRIAVSTTLASLVRHSIGQARSAFSPFSARTARTTFWFTGSIGFPGESPAA